MKERIRKVRNHFNLNQKDFSQRINIGSSTLAMLETGQRAIKDIHISQICSEFDVNEHWLRTGEGGEANMFVQPATFSLDEEAKKSNLSELEIAIMRGYMELDRDVREAIVSKLEGKLEDIIQQRMQTNEMAATAEKTPEQLVDEDVENYRLERLATLKGETSSASAKPRGELG